MQSKRLFIAIPLSSSVAHSVKRIMTEVAGKFEHFTEKEIRFAPQENWHLTVTFLGEQSDDTLSVIADAMKTAAGKFEFPEIAFEKISYGPSAKKPRMIWLVADRASSDRIAKIKGVLDDALVSRRVMFQQEMKLFLGHITLARFGEKMDFAALPQIERPLQFSFSGASLDLMESELKKSGAEYSLLQSFEFKE
jgi:2'-5' RNA ligase